MHVAVHGGEHDLALGDVGVLLEIGLELRHGLLHHLGALEHERQDQLAGAELVADLFHRRQQHRVEHGHRILALDRLVDQRLDPARLAMEDLVVDALLQGERSLLGLLRLLARLAGAALEVR